MPPRAERALRAGARKLGLTGKRKNAYIFGPLQRIEKAQAEKRKRRKRGTRR